MSFIFEKAGNKPLITNKQLKWNEFGIYIQNGYVRGIGLYDQKLGVIPSQIYELAHLELLSIVNTDISDISDKIGN